VGIRAGSPDGDDDGDSDGEDEADDEHETGAEDPAQAAVTVDPDADPGEPPDEPPPYRRVVRMHIERLEVTIEPLLPRKDWDLTDRPMRHPSPREEPHQQWHLRGIRRRGGGRAHDAQLAALSSGGRSACQARTRARAAARKEDRAARRSRP
jgi:hypothetical protein